MLNLITQNRFHLTQICYVLHEDGNITHRYYVFLINSFKLFTITNEANDKSFFFFLLVNNN